MANKKQMCSKASIERLISRYGSGSRQVANRIKACKLR